VGAVGRLEEVVEERSKMEEEVEGLIQRIVARVH
jgi:hypothetical protein